LGETAVFIRQHHRQPIQLWLGHVIQLHGRIWQVAANTLPPGKQIVGVEGVGQAQNGGRMGYLGKGTERFCPGALRRRIGRDQRGVGLLQRQQLVV